MGAQAETAKVDKIILCSELTKMEVIEEWFEANTERTVEPCKEAFADWGKDYANKQTWETLNWLPSGYGYSRCIVASRPPFFDIVAFRWDPHSRAPFHGHPSRGCIQLVLKGQLEETRFVPASLGSVVSVIDSATPVFIQADHTHSVSYKGDDEAISLHLYSPSGYTPVFERAPSRIKNA